MKNIFKYLCVGLMAGSAMVACTDDALETTPSDSMAGNDVITSTNTALISLNGIYRSMYTSGWSTTGNTHQCFGISAYNLMADVMGEDMIMNGSGSGWFWYDCTYNVKTFYTSGAWRSYDLWSAYYTWIAQANYLIDAQETMQGAEADKNYVLGQAYAIRAYSYFMLAQSFARTYKGHETEPCCPIYTTGTKIGMQGNPRSTVQEVYDLITEDLETAVTMLKGIERKHVSHINYAVACGFQARVALVMEDWQTALTAAAEAIKNSGCSILAVKDFAGVNSTAAKNVMWGAKIQADQSGIYAGFFTHLDASAGKYGSSARKQINKLLYDKMSGTDDRLTWWNPKDAANEKNGYQQEKFKFSNMQTWEGDYIWMRVEEMYLTAAEAACRLTEEGTAKQYLMALMKKRDANYSCNKTGVELGDLTTDETGSLLEEIITQRRIELWGEFGRIYDIRRLKQGFVRTAAMGWPAEALLKNRPSDNPESYMWVLTIPQKEFDGNANMDAAKDQNPTGDTK